MSKKKKKFKKKISQNLHERLAQIESEEKFPTLRSGSSDGVRYSASAESSDRPEGVGTAPVSTPATGNIKTSTTEVAVEDKYAYVKKDVKRDFLIILGLLAILTTVVILNQKTTIFINLSDWIYKVLNLSV